MRVFEPLVLRVLGLSIARGTVSDVEVGREWIRRAKDIATARGALPEAAHADLALARLSVDQGDLDDARARARDALGAYRRMSMAEWEARAESVLAVS